MAWKRGISFALLLIAALIALSSLAQASTWIAKSSDSTAPSWRRYVDFDAPLPPSLDTQSLSKEERGKITRHLRGEDELGPLSIKTTLVLYVPLPSHSYLQ